MPWGSNHETEATAGLFSAMPDVLFWESGVHVDKIYGMDCFVSPDGFFELQTADAGLVRGTVEIKCMTPYLAFSHEIARLRHPETDPIMYHFRYLNPCMDIPCRYMLQVVMQAEVTHMDHCLFVSYTPRGGTSVIRIKRPEGYFQWALEIMQWGRDKWQDEAYIPPNPFASMGSSYKLFLEKTFELSMRHVERIVEKTVLFEDQILPGGEWLADNIEARPRQKPTGPTQSYKVGKRRVRVDEKQTSILGFVERGSSSSQQHAVVKKSRPTVTLDINEVWEEDKAELLREEKRRLVAAVPKAEDRALLSGVMRGDEEPIGIDDE